MVTFVGLALDHAGVPRSSTLNGTWRASVFDVQRSAFLEAAMAYFFSYRQQAGASSRDLMDRDLGHMLGQNLVGLCGDMVENEG